MSLSLPAAFIDYVLTLPAVSVHEQWGSHVAKVGGKVFALVGAGGGAASIDFKVPETSFDILTSQDGVGQAPYFAKRHWVSVAPGAFDDDALKAYIAQAHRMVAAALTRKVKTELALEAYLAAGATA
jgi:predicted DNA-binding protein (MmcQ/YjbR family)